MGRPCAPCLQQVEQHIKEMGMGQASAWEMAKRRPLENRRKVDAAMCCSGTCSHTCPDLIRQQKVNILKEAGDFILALYACMRACVCACVRACRRCHDVYQRVDVEMKLFLLFSCVHREKNHLTLGLLLAAAPPTQSCLNNTFLHIFNKFVFAVLKKRKDFQNQCKVGCWVQTFIPLPHLLIVIIAL